MANAARNGRSLDDIFVPHPSTDALLAVIEASLAATDRPSLALALAAWAHEHWPDDLQPDGLACDEVAGYLLARRGVRDPVDLTVVAWRGLGNAAHGRDPDDDGDVLARLVLKREASGPTPELTPNGQPAIPARTRRHYRKLYRTGSLMPVLWRWQRDARIVALMRQGRSRSAAERAYRREQARG